MTARIAGPSHRIVSYRGRQMPLAAATALAGLSWAIVVDRLGRGWSVANALAEPLRKYAKSQETTP